jgi:hypothetical protein
MTPSGLSTLLDRWQQAFLAGRELTPAELCPERPDLASELARCIESLRLMNSLLGRGPAYGDAARPSALTQAESLDAQALTRARPTASQPRCLWGWPCPGMRSWRSWAAGGWASSTRRGK